MLTSVVAMESLVSSGTTDSLLDLSLRLSSYSHTEQVLIDAFASEQRTKALLDKTRMLCLSALKPSLLPLVCFATISSLRDSSLRLGSGIPGCAPKYRMSISDLGTKWASRPSSAVGDSCK